MNLRKENKRTPLSAEDAEVLRQLLRRQLARVKEEVDKEKHPTLSRLISGKWKARIQAWIDDITANRPAPPSQLGHFLNAIVHWEDREYYYGPDELEKRLSTVRRASEKFSLTKEYKSTANQLVADQANAVHASLFEISILYALLSTRPNLRVFPEVGEGRNVEAAIPTDRGDIYCECTVRGFAIIDEQQGARDPMGSPKAMVESVVVEKLKSSGQIGLISSTHPTILFTSVGADICGINYVNAIKDVLGRSACSACFLFNRYRARSFAVILNRSASHKVEYALVRELVSGMKEHLNSFFRGIYRTA